MTLDTDTPADIHAAVEGLITFYEKERQKLFVETIERNLLDHIGSNEGLMEQIHSRRSRVKAPESLRDKLHRQYERSVQQDLPFDITTDNLFRNINDLVGVRLLHLHTKQFGAINNHLHEVLDEYQYEVVEGPSARTWDDEYRAFFESLNIETVGSDTLYTSVHYVVKAPSRTPMTAEIQVRTLMEEVWGEVDHLINYPHESEHLPIREQIRALARSTSASTRLVDAIFRSNAHLRGERS